MAMRYAGGLYYNALEQANTVTMSPAADVLFPSSRLYDGRPSRIAKFGINAANCKVTFDLDILGGTGSFDGTNGAPPTGWTEANTGTGDCTLSTVTKQEGTASLQLAAGTGTASSYRDVTVRSGQLLTIEFYLRGDGTRSARVQIQNLRTGLYWNGTIWTSTPSDVAARSTASFAQTVSNFTVEDFLTCGQETTTLRVTALCNEATGTVFVDGLYLYPRINCAAVWSPNVAPVIATQVLTDTSAGAFAGAGTLQATLTERQNAYYGLLGSATAARYWRFNFLGTNPTAEGAPQVGQLVLTYAGPIADNALYGWRLKFNKRQVRNSTRSGEQYVYAIGGPRTRIMQMSFRQISDASFREMRDDILQRCGYGEYPLLVIPVDTEPDILLGRPTNDWDVVRQLTSLWDDDLIVEESPLPVVTS